MLSPETEQWLRHGYRARMSTDAVRRDLGAILAHGEPETASARARAPTQRRPARRPRARPRADAAASRRRATAHGELVTVDFGGLGPAGPDAA